MDNVVHYAKELCNNFALEGAFLTEVAEMINLYEFFREVFRQQQRHFR